MFVFFLLLNILITASGQIKWPRTKMSAVSCLETYGIFSLSEKLMVLTLKQMTLLLHLVR